MAGTDRTRRAPEQEVARQPVIILVEPQLGENIGAAARAMLNFGLTEMRVVNPRDGWPNHQALNTASGAESVLEQAVLFDSTEAAIADLGHIAATTARVRDMVKPVETPREAASRLRAASTTGHAGVLFGRERSGLGNEDVALADSLVIVPTNPGYSSINIAQAVLLVSYEWFQAGDDAERPSELTRKGAQPASKDEIRYFYEHLEAELDACGFLIPPEKRPRMVRNIRNIFSRANLTDQEVRTLRGIISGLVKGHGG